MPAEQVPIVQKQIIEAANLKGIPVITATQMLESMIHNPRPTRAEASDVANAILDGTDAVMLSGETAKGSYPVEAVQIMAQIAERVEASNWHGVRGVLKPALPPDLPGAPFGIGIAASAVVSKLDVKAVVIFTQSGSTARLVCQQRPHVPILAFTHSEQVYRRLALLWGVTPILSKLGNSVEIFEEQVQEVLVSGGYAHTGDLVVITGGHPIARRGLTNFLKIIEIA
jgi:pyruvate kinase